MKSVKAVLYGKPVRLPDGTKIEIGVTVRLRVLEQAKTVQVSTDDYPEPSTAEADSDG
jgi:hypothetical protein